MLFSLSVSAQSDKYLHFLINSHGVPSIGITMHQFGYSQAQCIIIPSAIMAAVSFGKEVRDKQSGGIFSWKDIDADMRGLITGAFITLAVNGVQQHIQDKRVADRAYQFYNPITEK